MLLRQKREVNLFDKFRLRIPSKYKSFADGKPGSRVLFLEDCGKKVCITFEEGMDCMDLTSDPGVCTVPAEHQDSGRYIHQLRTDPQARQRAGNFAFFHIKIPDALGKIHVLPGQMVASYGYRWSDGVEPILLEIMSGISICRTEVG